MSAPYVIVSPDTYTHYAKPYTHVHVHAHNLHVDMYTGAYHKCVKESGSFCMVVCIRTASRGPHHKEDASSLTRGPSPLPKRFDQALGARFLRTAPKVS